MKKIIYVVLISCGLAGLGWAFRQDLGFAPDDYTARMIQVPKSPYTAIAKGKVDIEGGIVEVSARTSGTYREVLVTEGDYVEAGQVLAVQEDDQEQIAVKNAKAALVTAEIALKRLMLRKRIADRDNARLKELVEIDASSAQELERAMDAYESLLLDIEAQQASMVSTRNALDSAKFRLDQRIVRAPRAGRIIEVKVQPGSGASTLNVTTAFTLMPEAQKIVRAHLDQSFVGQVKKGDIAIISARSGVNQEFEGSVMRVSEIFGRSSSNNNGGRGISGNDNAIELVIAAGDIPLLIGQNVMLRFPTEQALSNKALPSGASAQQASQDAQLKQEKHHG